MPNNIVNKVVQVCGIELDKAEQLWLDAEKRVIEQYGKKNKNNYQLIAGIFKHSLGKECNSKLGWETNWKRKPIIECIFNLFNLVK